MCGSVASCTSNGGRNSCSSERLSEVFNKVARSCAIQVLISLFVIQFDEN